MAQITKIEWTDATWNPVTGCDKLSLGCKNCYAERMALRLQAMNNPRYLNGFDVTLHEDLLDVPQTWRDPRLVFVNSMSDLFHDKVPVGFIKKILTAIREAERHTFQVLTKRSERLKKLGTKLDWPDNLWVGVTVESNDYRYRIHDLSFVPAPVRFLSLEPLLSRIPRLPLNGIHQVIVGGESGPGARGMEADWVREIRDRCQDRGVPFFFKQWGGVRKKENGKELDGLIWEQMPDSFQDLQLDFNQVSVAT